MSSKRILKRNLNNMVIDIVEECFTVQMFDETKAEASDKIIDEAASFQDSILADINKAKTKKDFAPITAKIETTALSFIEQLNALN
jgi:hypothetical protein